MNAVPIHMDGHVMNVSLAFGISLTVKGANAMDWLTSVTPKLELVTLVETTQWENNVSCKYYNVLSVTNETRFILRFQYSVRAVTRR